MHYRFAMAAWAFACAAVLPYTHAADWTSFNVGKVTGFSNTHAHLPDGRFLLGSSGSLYVQKTFGSSAKTTIPGGSIAFDPSCIAVKDASTALLGAGGFGSSSTVHLFNPALPTQSVQSSLATVFNYAAAWWQHPTSGRSGWIIAGTNGSTYTGTFGPSQKHNLTFVSADGTKVGSLTNDLSTYSGGMAIDAAGNVLAALYEVAGDADEAEAEKVLKFTADQVDVAVAAVLAGTPAPLAKSSGTLVHQFSSAGSIAVDSLNRVWATGYKISGLECFDPATGVTAFLKPDHPAITGAAGPVGYLVQTFTRNSTGYVSYLATDQYTTTGTAIMYGYRTAASVTVREVAFSTASQTASESAGAVTATITISPPPTVKTTVPITVTGTAANKSDYTIASTSIVFSASETSKVVTVNILNDAVDETNDSETIVLKLGAITPVGAGYVSPAKSTHTITITDDDVKPQFAASQSFTTGRVGAGYSYALGMIPNTAGLPTTFSIRGQPKGMDIDRLTGAITGRPTIPGEYDGIVVTATNSAGVSTSTAFSINVDDFAAMAQGGFVALSDRNGTATGGLGARLDVNVTAVASFSGKLTVGAIAVPISGALDTASTNPTGQASARFGATVIVVKFTVDASTGAISGSLDDGSLTKPVLSGWRVLNSTPLTGAHNFLVKLTPGPVQPVPHGHGIGTVTVQANASTSVVGTAADGSAFSSSAQLGMNGEVVVYQKLYATAGSFVGRLAIANDAPHSVSGALTWNKPAQVVPGSQVYPTGWASELLLSAEGGKYRAPAGTTAAIGLTSLTGYEVRIDFVGDTASAGSDGVLLPSGLITMALPTRLNINSSTGALNGTLTLGAVSNVAYRGLIIPDTSTPDPYDGDGTGWFIAQGTSGLVTLAER